MRQHEDEFAALDLWVGVITFQTNWLVDEYVAESKLPWPVLVDPDRALYRAYGMERGAWWSIWGPATLLAYAKLLARGRSAKRTDGDTRQLGGNVLIDPDGNIALHHVGSGPADRPAVSTMLDLVKARST